MGASGFGGLKALAIPSHEPLRLQQLCLVQVLWLGVGAHGWVVGIAGHGSITVLGQGAG